MSFWKGVADIESQVNRTDRAIEILRGEYNAWVDAERAKAKAQGKELGAINFDCKGYNEWLQQWYAWSDGVRASWLDMRSGNTFDTAEQWQKQNAFWRSSMLGAGIAVQKADPLALPEQNKDLPYATEIKWVAAAVLAVVGLQVVRALKT